MNMKDLNFFKKIYKFYKIGVYKSKVEIWAMFAQLDLEVMYK
jgi:hypothetical protein